MNTVAFTPVFALLFATVAMAQLAATPQPTPVQAQTAPCVSAPSVSQKSQPGTVAIKPPTKWQQYLDAQKKALAAKAGVVLPDTPTQLPLVPKTPSQPCLPTSVVQAAPALKLPADLTLSIHCNPVVAPKGAAPGAFPLFLPDPHAFAEPGSSNQWEADAAVPDINAKTPCYALKVNPKTNKYFVTQ